MSDNRPDLLSSYALGTLGDAETKALEAELKASPELQKALAETEQALGDFAFGAVTPIAPSPQLKDRLMASIGSGADRFAPFMSRLARAFDLGRDGMRAVMERAEDAGEWEAGPFPGSRLFHFDGGAAMAAADCGLVEFPAGFEHPLHHHRGEEHQLVLQGSLTDSDGKVYGPGDLIFYGPGTRHAYVCGAEATYVAAVALSDAIDVYPAGPDGPVITVGGPKAIDRGDPKGRAD